MNTQPDACNALRGSVLDVADACMDNSEGRVHCSPPLDSEAHINERINAHMVCCAILHGAELIASAIREGKAQGK